MAERAGEAALDGQRAGQLRRSLADRLEAGGHLRSAAWRAAVEAVPRHVFVPGFFRRTDGARYTMWSPVTPETAGADAWLAEVYADETLVTQLDGGTRPADVDGPVSGSPTSSSTLPRLVMRMLEDLETHEGDRVLEIGTGTGYSTALMCHRLGDKNITSIEYDQGAADSARAALAAAGYRPTLVRGDGLLGHEGNAPYDRLVATCSVRHIPRAWLEQVRPGGSILTTLSGWLPAFGLVRLTVAEDGTAEGDFLPGTAHFMIARPQAAPALGDISEILDQDGTRERPTRVGPEVLADWTPRFVAQQAAPSAQHVRVGADDGTMRHHLIDVRSRSFASLLPPPDDEGEWTVRQGGPIGLWDAVETGIHAWERAGSLPLSAFRLTIGRDTAQTVWLDAPDGSRWKLPV